MKRYNTSIKKLIQAKNEYEYSKGKVIFLSDWDSDLETIKIPKLKQFITTTEDIQKYYFWTDEQHFKDIVQKFFFDSFGYLIPIDSFVIGSNGTSSLMLSLTALKEMGLSKALIVTPMYFSTLNLLDELEFDVCEFNLSFKNDFKIDLNMLESSICQHKSEMLIITNPIFGSGVELDTELIAKISKLCNKYDIWLVMDYIYGGLSWNTTELIQYVFNFPVYESIKLTNKYIFVESISKRIFINGIKTALIFSTPNLIRRILRLSVFMVGSMSLDQINLVKSIYSNSNSQELQELIHENALMSSRQYDLISSAIQDSPFNISKASAGYFSILSIPKKLCIDDIEFSLRLLDQTGVLTTPHSRYLLTDDKYYSFRINLLLNKTQLLDGIIRLKNLM